MKFIKFIPVALGLFALPFMMGSCNKEKTCNCTLVTTGSPTPVPDQTSSFTTTEDCSDGNSVVTNGGITMTTTCD